MILSCHGVDKSVFFETDSIGGIPLRRPTKEYRDHRQVFTPGRIGYDSIYRYKGQQAPAVILVDVDPDPEKLEQAQRTLYCGMTRATVRLDLLADEANPENRKFFETVEG